MVVVFSSTANADIFPKSNQQNFCKSLFFNKHDHSKSSMLRKNYKDFPPDILKVCSVVITEHLVYKGNIDAYYVERIRELEVEIQDDIKRRRDKE